MPNLEDVHGQSRQKKTLQWARQICKRLCIVLYKASPVILEYRNLFCVFTVWPSFSQCSLSINLKREPALKGFSEQVSVGTVTINPS